ncbi:hypothetical protein Droror1_Dr00004437 [Drosera rotundifolia]
MRVQESGFIEEMAWAPRYGFKGMIDASATCFAFGKYGNGNQYPINLRAVVALSGCFGLSNSLPDSVTVVASDTIYLDIPASGPMDMQSSPISYRHESKRDILQNVDEEQMPRSNSLPDSVTVVASDTIYLDIPASVADGYAIISYFISPREQM